MNGLPPDPQNAILKKIYPWDQYNKTLVMQWLYAQAKETGFHGTIEDFKQRYGAYVESADPQDIYDLIESYTGTYHITPLVSIEQVLHTRNKILDQDIIIDPVPEELLDVHKRYQGQYEVTPKANFDQILRTKDKVLEENLVIAQIPYTEVSNLAGGTTVIIG